MTNNAVHHSPDHKQDKTAEISSQLVSEVEDQSNLGSETLNTSVTVTHSFADAQLASTASAVSSECSGTRIDQLRREDSGASIPAQHSPDCVAHKLEDASSGGGHGVLSREGRKQHRLLHLTIQMETGSLQHQTSSLSGLSLTPTTPRGNLLEGHLLEGSSVETLMVSNMSIS
jgi:hypothetical protein